MCSHVTESHPEPKYTINTMHSAHRYFLLYIYRRGCTNCNWRPTKITRMILAQKSNIKGVERIIRKTTDNMSNNLSSNVYRMKKYYIPYHISE